MAFIIPDILPCKRRTSPNLAFNSAASFQVKLGQVGDSVDVFYHIKTEFMR
jgi:hypothetical protein